MDLDAQRERRRQLRAVLVLQRLFEDPPLCVVGINPRSDGALKHSLKNIRRTGEFVVNLVDEATANSDAPVEPRVRRGRERVREGRARRKRRRCWFGTRAYAEAAACLECKLFRLIEISGTRQLVLGEILLIHARDGIIDPQTRRISEEHYKPVGRLFANRYCTTRQRFNLPGRPTRLGRVHFLAFGRRRLSTISSRRSA